MSDQNENDNSENQKSEDEEKQSNDNDEQKQQIDQDQQNKIDKQQEEKSWAQLAMEFVKRQLQRPATGQMSQQQKALIQQQKRIYERKHGYSFGSDKIVGSDGKRHKAWVDPKKTNLYNFAKPIQQKIIDSEPYKVLNQVIDAGMQTLPGKILDVALVTPVKNTLDAAHATLDLAKSYGQAPKNFWNPGYYTDVVWDAGKFATQVNALGQSLVPLGIGSYAAFKGLQSISQSKPFLKMKSLQGKRQGYQIANQLAKQFDFQKKIHIRNPIKSQIKDLPSETEAIWSSVKRKNLQNSANKHQIENNQKPRPILLTVQQDQNPSFEQISNVKKKDVLNQEKMLSQFGQIKRPNNVQIIEEIRKKIKK